MHEVIIWNGPGSYLRVSAAWHKVDDIDSRWLDTANGQKWLKSRRWLDAPPSGWVVRNFDAVMDRLAVDVGR